MSNDTPSVEDGQFDDALEVSQVPPQLNPREGHNFIDEENLLEWSSESEGEDEFDIDEDEMEYAAYQTLRAEDEDWEVAERDFTKQYNRLKQHVAVHTGSAQSIPSAIKDRGSVASLPAVNRPRAPARPQTSSASPSTSHHAKDKTENQLQALSKYSSRLKNLDMAYSLGVGVNRKGPSATANMKDKSDRATSEQVLDPRTRIILFKMIGRGLLFEVNGCVSTGKEANVYHALTPERQHRALKIYKTSILVFKDRDRYVTGEYRFRRGYSRHNPRKMVRVWAEKEMRNLKRLQTAGIRCPEPIEVRENVLVMGFIGDKDGWASPRLKDADIPATAFPALYSELVCTIRKLFHECKLVHADLSEYNILYHMEPSPTSHESTPSSVPTEQSGTVTTSLVKNETHGHLYIIDVSQSVEHDHPHAFDFLRSDLRNVEDFFSKRGVRCLGLRRAFEFVTTQSFDEAEENPMEVLKKRLEEIPEETISTMDDVAPDGEGEGASSTATHEDSVFLRSYIPRTLNEVYDPERDVRALARGEGEKLIYKDTIGIVVKEKDVQQTHEGQKPLDHFDGGESGDEGSEDSGGSETDSEEAIDGENEFQERKPRGHRHEDRDAKKERKKATKAEAREKRKTKIPKAEKKRKVKTTARGK